MRSSSRSVPSMSIVFFAALVCASCSGVADTSAPSAAGTLPSEDGERSDRAADATGETSQSGGTPTPGGGGEQTGPGILHPPLLVGRFDTSDPAGPKAAWPGTRILVRFEGSKVSVKLAEFADSWMEGAPSYWEVSIDKGPWKPIAMIADGQPHDFELASGLSAGPHDVEIYKRSETQNGVTQFLGFDFHGGESLASPPRQTRKIEVMGDSFASGFGVENIDSPGTDCPGADWGGVWQNFRKSWGAVLGTTFDAEVHGIVYSAKGVLRNDWPTDTDTLLDYYDRANPNPAIQKNPPLFDLESWIPDVILMTQGSGDDGGAAFKTAYRDFVVNRLRARGPDTHIFMGIVSAGNREAVADVAKSIVAERAAAGDYKIHVLNVKPFTWNEVTACNGHGTPAWNQRVADEIAAQIREKVGWQ